MQRDGRHRQPRGPLKVRNPQLDWRMRVEQSAEPMPVMLERIIDKHARGSVVESSGDPFAALQLCERTDQSGWFSSEFGARGVCQGFPGARHGQLNNGTDQEPDRVENNAKDGQSDNLALTVFAIGVDASRYL